MAERSRVTLLQCLFCEQKVRSENLMEVHEINAHKFCRFCDLNLNDVPEVLSHLAKVHSKRYFRCLKCEFMDPLLKNVRIHCIAFHNFCIPCNDNFESIFKLNEHLTTFHKKTPNPRYKCGDCNVMSNSEIRKETHQCPISKLRTKNAKIVRLCSMCNFGTQLSCTLQWHEINTHHYCRECSQTLPSKTAATNHLIKDHTDIANLCNFCDAINLDEAHFNDHNMAIHSFCILCKKNLENVEVLIEHWREKHNNLLKLALNCCKTCSYSGFFLGYHKNSRCKEQVEEVLSDNEIEPETPIETPDMFDLEVEEEPEELITLQMHECPKCFFLSEYEILKGPKSGDITPCKTCGIIMITEYFEKPKQEALMLTSKLSKAPSKTQNQNISDEKELNENDNNEKDKDALDYDTDKSEVIRSASEKENEKSNDNENIEKEVLDNAVAKTDDKVRDASIKVLEDKESIMNDQVMEDGEPTEMEKYVEAYFDSLDQIPTVTNESDQDSNNAVLLDFVDQTTKVPSASNESEQDSSNVIPLDFVDQTNDKVIVENLNEIVNTLEDPFSNIPDPLENTNDDNVVANLEDLNLVSFINDANEPDEDDRSQFRKNIRLGN